MGVTYDNLSSNGDNDDGNVTCFEESISEFYFSGAVLPLWASRDPNMKRVTPTELWPNRDPSVDRGSQTLQSVTRHQFVGGSSWIPETVSFKTGNVLRKEQRRLTLSSVFCTWKNTFTKKWQSFCAVVLSLPAVVRRLDVIGQIDVVCVT